MNAAPNESDVFNYMNKRFLFTNVLGDSDLCSHGAWGAVVWVACTKNVSKWLARSLTESKNGRVVALLVPARTYARYWHQYVIPHASEVLFIRGLVKRSCATVRQSSAVVIFGRSFSDPQNHASVAIKQGITLQWPDLSYSTHVTQDDM